VKDSLDKLLIDNQFHRFKSNIPYITLYEQYNKEHVSLIQIFDFRETDPITVTAFNSYRENAIEFAKKQDRGDVFLLTILITEYVEDCKKYVIDDNYVWIIDSDINRLFVYERQIGDYCGLRRQIEALCIKRGGSRSPSSYREKLQAQKNRNFVEREFTVVNSLLVCINVVIFIILSWKGSTLDIEYMLDHGVMYVPKILMDGEYYRFITCTFLHFGFQHLIGNMVVLLFIGDNVERNVGWFKYILLYLGAGLSGSAGSFLYAYYLNQGIVSAGASGAIYGVMGALLWLVIRNKGRLEDMTIMRVCVMISYAVYSGFTSENIDMAAHLFGFVGGFILAMLLYRKEKKVG